MSCYSMLKLCKSRLFCNAWTVQRNVFSKRFNFGKLVRMNKGLLPGGGLIRPQQADNNWYLWLWVSSLRMGRDRITFKLLSRIIVLKFQMNLPNRSYCQKKHCVYRRKTDTFNDDTPIILYNAKKFWFGLQCLTATFNNISVILWQSALLVEETRVPWENNRPAASDSMSLTDKLYHIMLYTKLRSIKISI